MKRKILFYSAAAVLLSAFILLFHRADRFLIRDDDPVKADALVMLMGSVADRVLQTADLYNAGYSSRIIIVEENMQGIDSLLVRGIEVKSNAEICSNYLNALGVPGEAVTILPGKAKSTREEAEIISKYLSSQPEIKRLIIVSSPFHTRRALLIFRKALKKQNVKVQIKVSPSGRYYEMHDNPWWSGKEGIQAVATEYIKLFSFILIEQFCIE